MGPGILLAEGLYFRGGRGGVWDSGIGLLGVGVLSCFRGILTSLEATWVSFGALSFRHNIAFFVYSANHFSR